MPNKQIESGLASLLSVVTLIAATACTPAEKKFDFAGMIQSSSKSRTLGHEDAAANDLKEAYDRLPPVGSPDRVQDINLLYPELLALAAALKVSGRFSLSTTLLDKAIEIEPECTLADKKSAKELKLDTEKTGDMELSLLKRADKTKELRKELKSFKHITKDLAKAYDKHEYETVARDGRTHLEAIRKARGTASHAYCDARTLVVNSLLHQGNSDSAIKLLEDDVPELSNFKDQDLKSGDEEAVESALFLSPLLGEVACLEVTVGQFENAEKNARRSIALAKMVGGETTSESSLSQVALVLSLRGQKKQQEALDSAKNSLPILSQPGYSDANRFTCLYLIADLQDSLGQTDEAKHNFLEVSKTAETRPGLAGTSIGLALAAAFFRKQGDEKKYEQFKSKSIELLNQKCEMPETLETVYETLGDSSSRSSKFTEALNFYQSALKNANQFHRQSLEKKIAMCMKNKSVTS